MPAPALDQIEISVIGPGYGECSLIHIGGGKWIIVDSCIDNTSDKPAALAYLESIGVNPAEAVLLIFATHWHDDHIRGLAKTLNACPTATFCCSSTYNKKEFLTSVLPYEERNNIHGGSGVKELSEILRILEKRTTSNNIPKKALANRRVFHLPADETEHRNECNVWTLSPCDQQFEKFLVEIASLIPKVKTTKFRATPQPKNNLSIVLWIEIGNTKILLGADLEETEDPNTGWSVIVASTERPTGKAQIFKIPHHGSITGHNDDVWKKMLIASPLTALTPFNRGRKKLPSLDDLKRILEISPNSYSTSRTLPKKTKRTRPTSVEKMIKETVGRIRPAESRTGRIQIRNGGNSAPDEWIVELISAACSLTDLLKSA